MNNLVKNKPAKTSGAYHITAADLPLACPLPFQDVSHLHPRVYLPIEEKKRLHCPYCGTVYELVEELSSG